MGVDTPEERLAKNKTAGFTPTITPTAGQSPNLNDLAKTAVNEVRAGEPKDPLRRGRARLDDELARLRMSTSDPNDLDKLIVNLSPDTSDSEYNTALMVERARAAARIAARARGEDNVGTAFARRGGEGTLGPDTTEQQAWADKINTEMAKPENAGSQRAGGMRPEDQTAYDEYKRQTKGKPVIKGLPVDAGTVLGEASTTDGGSGLSEWIRQWATKQGLDVSYTDAQEASQTGDFVYVGQQEDTKGGPGYMRDVYVYKDDANSGMASMSTEEIANYQSQLGLEVTGILDPKLQALWERAVGIGQQYARAGQKVELKFIFDTLVASAVADGGLGSGGGGGGGSNRTDADYYFAMMQVMGDIGGVKVVNG